MAQAAQRRKQYIEINGNVATLVEKTVHRTMDASVLMTNFAKGMPNATPILPSGTVLYERGTVGARNEVQEIYVVERMPAVVPVRFAHRDTVTDLSISWPWTYWIVRVVNTNIINSTKVVCRVERLTAAEDSIFTLPMPNFNNNDAEFCTGSVELGDTDNARDKIEELIEGMITSRWNADLWPNFEGLGLGGNAGTHGSGSPLHDWHEKTEADPEVGLKLKYHPFHWATLRELMNELLGGGGILR